MVSTRPPFSPFDGSDPNPPNGDLLVEDSDSSFTSVVAFRRMTLVAYSLILPLLFFTQNSTISVVAHLILIVFTALLWNPKHPPILYFGWLMQWLQCAVSIYYHDFLEVKLAEVDIPNLEPASWSAITGSVALGIGIWMMQIPGRKGVSQWNPQSCYILKLPKLFLTYLLITAASTSVNLLAWSFPAVTQFILGVAQARWGLVFLIFLTVLVQKRGFSLLFGIFGFEILSGFMGFFGEFKAALYALLIAILCLPGRSKAVWMTLPTMIIGIILSVFWSSIKIEYRSFLNKNSARQVVLVSTSEKIERLSDLLSGADLPKIAAGVDATINRLAYVDWLGRTMAYVPSSTPHENGALWRGAIEHVLVPRFMNPNKGSLDDSERTRQYTGMRVGGRDEGTSIGLGYVAESYVDFGRVWMNVPLLAIGIWIGFLYRVFINQRFFQPLGAGFLFVSIALNAHTIEISATKFLGVQVMLFVIFFPLLFWISRRVIPAPTETEHDDLSIGT